MIECKTSKNGGETEVTFIVPPSEVNGQTAVVGDFNGWAPTATPLRERRGRMSATVSVPPGRRYAFRYLAEGGRWFNDEAADDYQPNDHGGSDSVLDLTAMSSP